MSCVLSTLTSCSAAEVSVHQASRRFDLVTIITFRMTTIWAGRTPEVRVDFALIFATLPPSLQRGRAGSSARHSETRDVFSSISLSEER